MAHLSKVRQGFWLLALLAVICLLMSGKAFAQNAADPAWQATADTAEAVLAEASTSSTTLETLRAELVDQREAAKALSEDAQPGIEILQNQLDALGEVIDNEAELAPDVARRRAELTRELEEARAPLLDGELAFQRADTLISRIDETLRSQLANRLTALGPSPLNPLLWSDALAQMSGYWDRIFSGYTQLRSTSGWRPFAGQIPFAILLGIIAIVLPFVALPRALNAIYARQENRVGVKAAFSGKFSALCLRVIVVCAAAVLVILALRQIDAGHLPTPLLELGLPKALGAFAVAYIAARSLFDARFGLLTAPVYTESQAHSAGRLIVLLGAVLGLAYILDAITTGVSFSDGSRAVLYFPLFVLGALFLWPLARILIRQNAPSNDAEEGPATSLRILRWFARFAIVIAVALPVIAVIGYFNLANFLFGPTLLTFFVLAMLLVIYIFLRDFLEFWLLGASLEDPKKSPVMFRLMPVFIAIILFVIGLPVLALIWGARLTDLQEIWFWLSDGIPIGEARLSVPDILTSIVIFVIGYLLTRSLQGTMRRSVLPRTDLDLGAKNAIVTGLGYVGIFLAALLAITASGLNLSNLAIVAGALSVGIGFGLQTIVSNFVSGIILLIERPIKEGDWIEVAGHAGYVNRISVRATSIKTFDKASVIVPNAELIAGTVLNRTHQSLVGRVVVPIGVAYGTDPRAVEKLLLEVGRAHPMVVSNPPVGVVFVGFGADALDFEIRAHIRDVNYSLTVKSDMNYEIAEKFEAAGIEIPFAQRDVAIKDAEKLIDAIKRDPSS